MLIVGTEWLVEAAGCDAEALRDAERVRAVLARAVAELGLRVVGDVALHKFPGAGGVTGLVLLTESHLACHTYPEFGVATFNLYCCRARPRWAWEERLAEMLGAARVSVRVVERRAEVDATNEAADVSLEVGGAGLEGSVVRIEETEAPLAFASEAGGPRDGFASGELPRVRRGRSTSRRARPSSSCASTATRSWRAPTAGSKTWARWPTWSSPARRSKWACAASTAARPSS